MRKDRTTDAAFTLTEVIVAVVLMLLALGLLLSAFISSKRSVTLAQSHFTALHLALSEAEQIRTNAYTNVVSAAAIVTNAFIAYTINRSVTTNAPDSYRDITIAVEWAAPASARLQALTNYMTICSTNRN